MNQKDFDNLAQSIKQAGRKKGVVRPSRVKTITRLMFGQFETNLESLKASSH